MKTPIILTTALAAFVMAGCQTGPDSNPSAAMGPSTVGKAIHEEVVVPPPPPPTMRTSAVDPMQQPLPKLPSSGSSYVAEGPAEPIDPVAVAAMIRDTTPITTIVVVEPFPVDSKDQFVASVDERLLQLSDKIDSLEVYLESLNTDEQMRRDIESLRQLHADVTTKLDEVKAAGPEAWGEFSPGVEAALNELDRTYVETNAKYED